MKKLCMLSTILGIGLLAFGITPTLRAQASASGTDANADIVKMIQAGLPESVVVSKIRGGSGHWDASVDALIALKKAGATEAELKTLTATPDPPMTQQTAAMPPAPVDNGQSVLGGIVKNDHGNVTFAVQDGVDEYRRDLLFRVVLVDGAPSLLLNIESIKWGLTVFQCTATYGDLLVSKDQTTFFPYAHGATKCDGDKWIPSNDLKPTSYRTSEVDPRKGPGAYGTKLGKDGPRFEFGNAFMHRDKPTQSQAFLDFLFKDFSGTMTAVLQAAGISDPATQLSSESRYHAPTKEEAAVLVEQHNLGADAQAKIAEINKAQRVAQEQEEAKLHPQSNSGNNGNGWLSTLNAVQGVANMQQAMQNAKTADLTHDTAGQLRAAANATTAEMQTLGAVSGNTTTIQPIASTSSTQTHPTAVQMRPNGVAAPQKATGFTYNVSHGQPASSSATSNNIASSAQPKANPNPGGTPSGVNTGTVAPANCVYLSPSQPCVPLAQYQQMQSQQQASGQGICPASGFVPGVMLRQASDVAVGVPCKPGTPYGPLIATTASSGYTGVTPPDQAARSGGASSFGSSDTGGPFDPNLNDCIVYFYKNDPITGDHLILQNNCSVRAQVYFYASSQVHGGVAIDPGATDNTYAAHDQILAAGVLSIYACPVNDIPRQADGTLAYNGVNNRFLCSQK